MIFMSILMFTTLYGQQKNSNRSDDIPHLEQKGKTYQLMVDGNPFLILGGELGNSSFTSLEYMKPNWKKLTELNLNTVLAPIYWELIEPVEDKFDFDLYDKLINEARKNNLKLILLWFGSWKNSMSSHVPSWVKLDQERFPRAKDDQGRSQEILSPFSNNNLQADLKAFRSLMQHIKDIDKNDHTIIMVQVENEIGMLPSARDYSELANERFNDSIPTDFIEYLSKNKENLVLEFKELWEKNGYKKSGTWKEIFGEGLHTYEIFMAWYFAKFTNAITEAGKEIYPLPMYVNAALNRPGRLPGEGYPSGGPLPHLMDIWKVGAPSIDFLAPDIYFPNIKYWCDLYVRQNNVLFIPEAGGDSLAAAKAFFTIGHYNSLGYSPFSIESIADPENEPLGKVYDLIKQIIPLITSNKDQYKIDAVLLDKELPESVLQFGDYEFTVEHSYTLGYEANSKNDQWETAGAIIIQTGENEFYLVGSGVVITFKNIKNPDLIVGILKDEEGKFIHQDSIGDDRSWKVIRYLNGDQTHQGRHIRIFFNNYSIQRFELYNYK